jgi:hypothetical protein
MHRNLIDRSTDTAVFRLMLFVSGWLVLPVLGMGVLTTVIGGAAVFIEPSFVGLEQVAFALLSIGGAMGFVGYLRAHRSARESGRHHVAVTLVCLAMGVGAALAVAVYAAAAAVESWLTPSGSSVWLGLAAAFALANVVWAWAGAAWMWRLARRGTEHAGHAFDGLPIVLLIVALALATTAALVTATL